MGNFAGNWKTTVTALVGAAASLIGHFGFNITPEMQSIIITLTVLAIGFFAKDGDKTGTTDQPR